MSKPIVVSLGELLWDMLPTGKRAGGAPVNFAYHATNNGCEAYAVSAVGEDELGDELAIAAEKAGIHAVLQRNAWPTGTVEVALKNGIPEYTIVENVAWDHISYTRQLIDIVEQADAVCFGTLAQRSPESHDTIIELLKHTKDGALKFFDINLRGDMYSKELIEEMLSYANVFKINDEELLLLRGMFGIENTSDEEACKWFIEQFACATSFSPAAPPSPRSCRTTARSPRWQPRTSPWPTPLAPATRSPAPSPAAFSTATPSASHTAQP